MTEVSCKDCGGILQDSAALLIHMDKTHNKIPNLVCKLCDERCLGFDDFDKHLEYAHGTKHWSLNLGLKKIKRGIKKTGEYFESYT